MTDVIDTAGCVTMPALSAGMADGSASGRVVRWFVREGQFVEPGDLLAEVASGTSTAEVEAKVAGRVQSLLFPVGADGITAHAPIARLEEKARRDASQTDVGTSAHAHADADGVISRPVAPTASVTTRVAHAIDEALAAPVTTLSYREALRDALSEAMSRNPQVIVLGDDVAQNRGAQRVTQGLEDAFGRERVLTLQPFDDAAFSFAVGAALGGLIPVVEVASWGMAFEAMTAALDTAVALPVLSGGRVSVPLVIRGPYGWTAGASGLSAAAVAARLLQVPHLKVVVPSTPVSAKLLLAAAICDGGPVAVLEADDLYQSEGPVPDAVRDAGSAGGAASVIGAAHVARAGTHLTLVVYGRLLARALAVAERFADQGIAIEVIDLLSLRPLDTAAIAASLKTTRRLLIVEDGGSRLGIGAQIIAELAADPSVVLAAPPLQLGGWDGAVPYGSAYDGVILPSEQRLESAIQLLLG